MKELAGSTDLRTRWSALGAILVLSIAGLGCERIFGAPTPEVTVVLTDFAFEPQKVTINRTEKTKLLLENRGSVEHTFSVPQLNVTSARVPPGTTGTLEITSPRGPLRIICVIPGHEDSGMVGELVVERRR